MIPLLSLFRPLLLKRDTYYVAAIILLLVLWLGSKQRVKTLELTLATKATVETQKTERVDKDIKTDTRKEQGKVKIVYKYTPAPDGCSAILTEKIEEREPVTTITNRGESVDRQTAESHNETPACPQYAPRTWGIGGGFDLKNRDRGSISVSKSFGDFTLGLGHAVGAGAKAGDVNASASIKVW